MSRECILRGVKPKVWTAKRRWLGNLVPALFWLPPTVTGAVWIVQKLEFLGPGLWLLVAGQVIGWIALNRFGLWENRRMRREWRREHPPELGDDAPRFFVGMATPLFRSLLDAHEDVGDLILRPDKIEFVGERHHIHLLRKHVTTLRYLPNVHSSLGLGRWVAVEGTIEGRPIRLLVEPRERDTLLANRRYSRELSAAIRAWRGKGGSGPKPGTP